MVGLCKGRTSPLFFSARNNHTYFWLWPDVWVFSSLLSHAPVLYGHQLGLLQFSLILTLGTWSWHQISQGKGSGPADCLIPAPDPTPHHCSLQLKVLFVICGSDQLAVNPRLLQFPLLIQLDWFWKFWFVYFWHCWVFAAEHGLSPIAASGGCSLAAVLGFSLQWLLLWSSGSRACGLR